MMMKVFALAAMFGCFGMLGCWNYTWAPKCEDDLIVGARSAESTQLNAHAQPKAIRAN